MGIAVKAVGGHPMPQEASEWVELALLLLGTGCCYMPWRVGWRVALSPVRATKQPPNCEAMAACAATKPSLRL